MKLTEDQITVLKIIAEDCPREVDMAYDFTRIIKKIGGLKEDVDILLQQLHSMGYIDYVSFNPVNLGRVKLIKLG